jgi:hypothetical protein
VSGVTCLQWRGLVNDKSKPLQNSLLRVWRSRGYPDQSGSSAVTTSVQPKRTGIKYSDVFINDQRKLGAYIELILDPIVKSEAEKKLLRVNWKIQHTKPGFPEGAVCSDFFCREG